MLSFLRTQLHIAVVGLGTVVDKLKEKRHPQIVDAFYWMQQQPIFPDRRQSSIVGASELNFCVRYENRWDLTANVTAMVYIGFLRVYLF